MLSACQNNSVGVSVAVVAWPDFFEACEVIKIIHTSKARESPDIGVRPLRCFLSFDCCRNPGSYCISETTPALMNPGFPATLDVQISKVTVTLYGYLVYPPQAPTYRLYLSWNDLVSLQMCGTQPPPGLFLCLCPGLPT